MFGIANAFLPSLLATIVGRTIHFTAQHQLLLHSISLLVLGIFLATLATLNFSLSLFVGLLSTPLSFIGNSFSSSLETANAHSSRVWKIWWTLIMQLLSPTIVTWLICAAWGVNVGEILAEAAFGWKVNGLWTQVIVWCVWWPAWLAGSMITSPSLHLSDRLN